MNTVGRVGGRLRLVPCCPRLLPTPYPFARLSAPAFVRSVHSKTTPQSEVITDLINTFQTTQPRFPVRGDEIEVLSEPKQFYQALLGLIKRAKKRLVISSLYIGTEQDELLAAIRSALEATPSLRVTFLLDHNRCTREQWPAKSTASVLYPLVRDFPGRAEAWFYRSPKLSGLMEWLVPRRFDEGWGTWHAKIYGGDEEVIISGANLSKDYFTTRQDRYFYFRNSLHLTTYLSNLLRLYTGYSYLLLPNPPSPIPYFPTSPSTPTPSPSPSSSDTQPYTLYWPHTTVDPRDFHAHAFATLSAFQASWSRKTRDWEGKRVDADTSVWPVLQAGVLGIKEEENAMGAVWKAVDRLVEDGDRVLVDLTSGYFSLYGPYKKAVVESKADVRIIAAAPKSNGFFGSKGISRLIPEGYTLLERDFEREVAKRGRSWKVSRPTAVKTDEPPAEPSAEHGHGVQLTEWEREGWTYHSKGIWVSPTSTSLPSLTMIGSSNLSTRSCALDVETSFFINTTSVELQKALKKEIDLLRVHSQPHQIDGRTWKLPERKVSWQTWALVKGLGVKNML